MFLPWGSFLRYLQFPLQLSEQQQGGGGEKKTKETEQRDERAEGDSEGGREEGDGENPDFNLRGRRLPPLANQYKRRWNPEDPEHEEGGDGPVQPLLLLCLLLRLGSYDTSPSIGQTYLETSLVSFTSISFQ